MENKTKYKQLLQKHAIPLFYQDWYLDIVCDGEWDVVFDERVRQITGFWVYMLKQKFLLRYIVPPQFCPYTGFYSLDSRFSQQSFDSLKSKLPSHQLLIQKMHPTIQIETGFKESSERTYIISKNENIDDLWENLSSDYKRKIRKADRHLSIKESDDFEAFYRFINNAFKERKQEVYYDQKIFQRIDRSLAKRNQRKIYVAMSEEGKIMAGLYLMSDDLTNYNFVNAVQAGNHYGMYLLIWKMIEKSLKEGKAFDFEGSKIDGVENFYRRFGGERIDYKTIYKSGGSLIDAVVKLKNPNLTWKSG